MRSQHLAPRPILLLEVRASNIIGQKIHLLWNKKKSSSACKIENKLGENWLPKNGFFDVFIRSQAILLRKTFQVPDRNRTRNLLIAGEMHWATWTQMVSEGYIYVLVRTDGRHMYCQSASLNMSSKLSMKNNWKITEGFHAKPYTRRQEGIYWLKKTPKSKKKPGTIPVIFVLKNCLNRTLSFDCKTK